MNAPTLRPDQLDEIARIESAISAGSRRPLFVSPTGSGKTIVAAALIAKNVACGGRVLVVVHRRELIEQTSRKLHDVGVDHGIIQAGYPARPGPSVQVASIQTLHTRAARSRKIELPRASLVIIDEAHHARARTYMWLIRAYPDAVILGLTATPCRADGRGLGNVFQTLIEGPSVAELTRSGHLVPAKIYAPVRPDLSGIRIERGDYVESQLAQRMDTAPLVGDIVEHWHRLAEGRPTVVFTVNVAHSVHLRNEFRRSGVLAEHIDGLTPVEERKRILARFADGRVDIICNCAVLTEGWDRPEASCLILARPTRSLGLYLQMTGRILRTAPGKPDALILDHSGAVFIHGFPDDEIAWALHEDKRAENISHANRGAGTHAPALTTCPECSAVRLEGRSCPRCSWRPVRKPGIVKIEDGELGKVTRDRTVHALPQEKFTFYREVRGILAEKRGRKPTIKDGWAEYKFKEKFGDWPPFDWRSARPLPPSPATRAWVRSRDIAFAKARRPRR
jgi:superfamily II DNA or RNA helicase